MSGGVDSSVAAALLRDAGHEITGITLRLQACDADSRDTSCCAGEGLARARETCRFLGIPHYELPCAAAFEREVLRPAWDEYARGRTPSPCLLCNERVKLGLLAARAREIGATRIATGHYARIEHDARGDPILARGADRAKDQSYFLAGLDRAQLREIVFPLGSLTKEQVRARAAAMGLSCARARESQDACFREDARPFAEVLRARFGAAARPGAIVDDDGTVLGRHEGIHRFTIGQRRALGVAAGDRRWVRAIDADTGTVFVTADERRLLSRALLVEGLHWREGTPPAGARRCEVQVRSRHAAAACRVRSAGAAGARVDLDQPVRAATPGQAAVFYDGDAVLGQGWVETAEPWGA